MENINNEKKYRFDSRSGKFILGLILGVVISMGVSILLGIYNKNIGYVFARDMQYEEKIKTIYNVLEEHYVDEVVEEDLEEMMYRGLVAGLNDPYSEYMSEENFKSFMESSSGTYYGIGAVVSPTTEDNKIVIVTPYKDCPAYNVGIRAGDKILQVNGIDVFGDKLEEAVSMMKGPKGTDVEVMIEKSSGEMELITITRDEIQIVTIEHELLDNNLGYIKISAFDEVTKDQFNEAYEGLLQQNIEGLVIDLRNNPGGLLHVVADITDRLIPKGFITYTEDKNGERDYIYSNAEEIEIPLVILVNGNSASASEVLSGAVQDTGKGILVGEQTFGKGLVQSIFPLQDGSAIKTTISRYYTPNGICIHGEGITPDYVVDMSDEDTANLNDLSFAEDIQMQKAVEVLKGEIQ